MTVSMKSYLLTEKKLRLELSWLYIEMVEQGTKDLKSATLLASYKDLYYTS